MKNSLRRAAERLRAAIVLFLAVACGGGPGAPIDAETDAGGHDTGNVSDASSDAGFDSGEGDATPSASDSGIVEATRRETMLAAPAMAASRQVRTAAS